MKRLIFFRLPVLFLLVIAFLSGIKAIGQNSTDPVPDARLQSVYKHSKLMKMVNKEPEKLQYLTYFLDHSWFISEGAKEKTVSGTDIYQVSRKKQKSLKFNEDISVFETKIFNPLLYNFEIDPVHYTFYPIGNTGKVLVFYPQYIIDEMYAKYQQKFNNKK